jgi:hypothetical protein
MNCLVPDLAIVPKLLIKSLLVIPIPESQIVKVLLVLSGMILMKSFSSLANTLGSVMERYLILSKASDAFEISSLKKISLFE